MRRRRFAVSGMGVSPYDFINRVQAVRPTSLIDLWPLEDISGSTAIDVVASARNGTYVNNPSLASALFVDNIGNAPTFSAGSSQSVALPAAAISSVWSATEGSLLIWAKLSLADWNAAGRIVFAFLGMTSGNFIEIFKQQPNVLAFRFSGSAFVNITKSSMIDTNWMALVMTWSVTNNRIRGFYDSQQVGSQSVTTLSGILNVAKLGTDGGGFMNGGLCMGALWTAELTISEIATISGAG